MTDPAKTINQVYFFPLDGQGKETGEALPVTLNEQGEADLSRLPADIRETLEFFGVQDRTHTFSLFPKDGGRFLEALLHSGNPYFRFRTQAIKS